MILDLAMASPIWHQKQKQPKKKEINKKRDKLDFTKIENFCAWKNIIQWVKRQPTEWRKILYLKSYTGILCFLKVLIRPLSFSERPTLVPVFTNRKKSQEDFQFYKKDEKQN